MTNNTQLLIILARCFDTEVFVSFLQAVVLLLINLLLACIKTYFLNATYSCKRARSLLYVLSMCSHVCTMCVVGRTVVLCAPNTNGSKNVSYVSQGSVCPFVRDVCVAVSSPLAYLMFAVF